MILIKIKKLATLASNYVNSKYIREVIPNRVKTETIEWIGVNIYNQKEAGSL